MWVLKCVFKWLTRENAESHWLHFFDFSLPSVPLIRISLAVFLPKSRCSRFRSISRSVLALAIFVSNWYVKRLHLIWIGRIETESEFHQYFLNISKDPYQKNSNTWTQPAPKLKTPTCRNLPTRWSGTFSHMNSKIWSLISFVKNIKWNLLFKKIK